MHKFWKHRRWLLLFSQQALLCSSTHVVSPVCPIFWPKRPANFEWFIPIFSYYTIEVLSDVFASYIVREVIWLTESLFFYNIDKTVVSIVSFVRLLLLKSNLCSFWLKLSIYKYFNFYGFKTYIRLSQFVVQ